jgi:hypothetical protein
VKLFAVYRHLAATVSTQNDMKFLKFICVLVFTLYGNVADIFNRNGPQQSDEDTRPCYRLQVKYFTCENTVPVRYNSGLIPLNELKESSAIYKYKKVW